MDTTDVKAKMQRILDQVTTTTEPDEYGMSVNGKKIVQLVDKAVQEILSNFIAGHVLSPVAGFSQADGTFAIFNFNKMALLELANMRFDDKYKKISEGYALHIIQKYIENIIE